MEDAGREVALARRAIIGERWAGHGLVVAVVLALLATPVGLAAAGPVQLGPPHSGWVLWASGVISSLGAGAVRTAVLAVVVSVLLVERRVWAAGYVLASSALVHVADRLGKQFSSRSRPLDPQTGWALPRLVVVAVLVGVLVVGFALVVYRHRSAWWFLPVAWATVVAVDRLARMIPVGRGSDSFPSGHAANTMALALALAVVAVSNHRRRRVAEGAIAFAVLVGISRLTLGFHHPADVLAGWTIALVATVGLRLVVGADRIAGSTPPSIAGEQA